MIDFDKLKHTIQAAGVDLDCVQFKENGIRFDYWRSISVELLQELNEVTPVEEDYDYDEECGAQYFYRFI